MVYYGGFILILQFSWAAVQLSHLAMIPELTSSESEYTLLTSIRYDLQVPDFIKNIATSKLFILHWLNTIAKSHRRIIWISLRFDLIWNQIFDGLYCLWWRGLLFVQKEGKLLDCISFIPLVLRNWENNLLLYNILRRNLMVS